MRIGLRRRRSPSQSDDTSRDRIARRSVASIASRSHSRRSRGQVRLDPRALKLIECCDGHSRALYARLASRSARRCVWRVEVYLSDEVLRIRDSIRSTEITFTDETHLVEVDIYLPQIISTCVRKKRINEQHSNSATRPAPAPAPLRRCGANSLSRWGMPRGGGRRALPLCYFAHTLPPHAFPHTLRSHDPAALIFPRTLHSRDSAAALISAGGSAASDSIWRAFVRRVGVAHSSGTRHPAGRAPNRILLAKRACSVWHERPIALPLPSQGMFMARTSLAPSPSSPGAIPNEAIP